jgi:hypothetical protein
MYKHEKRAEEPKGHPPSLIPKIPNLTDKNLKGLKDIKS